MKILYILSEYLPDSGGGIISHYARILPRLVERGHEVKVLVANHASLDRAARVEDGVEVEYLRSSFAEAARAGCKKFRNDAFWAFLPLAWGAFHQVKGGEGFDIVEATDWGLLFMPWVVSERKAKVVVSLHGSNGQVDWFSNPEPRGFDGSVVRLAEVAALPLADAIHANSRANAEFWREKTGREIRVIPPAYGGCSAPEDSRSEIADRATTKCTKGHEKGEEASTTDSTDEHGYDAGHCLGKPSGAVFSNPFTSELARDSENSSPTRSAIGPAGAAEPPRADGGGLISDGTEFPKALDSRPSSLDLSSPATSHLLLATAPKAQALDPRRSTLDAPGLVVGRLQNWKGAEVLCKALEMVDGIQIEWVGGDTPWGIFGEKASEYLKKNYPSVWGAKLYWQGPLPRAGVLRKISGCSFLVVPSLWDVFNLTVAEGMEAGVPVICSKAAGAEMLIEHGRSGFLFDPAKPEELAECLKIVAGMSAAERMEMGKMAHGSVKNVLEGEKIIHLLEESYGLLIKKDTQPRLDPWLASLLSPALESNVITKMNFAQRALRKVGRIFANA